MPKKVQDEKLSVGELTKREAEVRKAAAGIQGDVPGGQRAGEE